MLNNQQQNNDFDFDEEVLVKDESGKVHTLDDNTQSVNTTTSNSLADEEIDDFDFDVSENLLSPQENFKKESAINAKKTKKQHISGIKETTPRTARFFKNEKIQELQEKLIKKVETEKSRIKSLNQEGEGLIFGERDEEEIEKIKKERTDIKYADVDALTQCLIGNLQVVPNLKINLVVRLKNIIASYLRDVRNTQTTKELLLRSVEAGGMGLSLEQAEKIMELIMVEYKRLHLVESAKEIKSVCIPSILSSKEIDTESISKKTAKDAQIGIFSKEIGNKKKSTVFKTEKKDELPASTKKQKSSLLEWKNKLFIPKRLQTAEIEAPDELKKISKGVTEKNLNKNDFKSTPKTIDHKKIDGNNVFRVFDKMDLNKNEQNTKAKIEESEITSKAYPIKPIDKIEQKDTEKKPKKTLFFGLFGNKKESKKVEEEDKKIDKEVLQDKKDMQKKNEIINSADKDMSIPEKQIYPKVFRDTNFDISRPKIEDVKIVPAKLTGPVEELQTMSLVDFRRLGPTTQNMVDKIREKISLADEYSFSRKIETIKAWQKSQPNKLYLELGRESLLKRIPISDLIIQYKENNKPVLTQEEFNLIGELNKELRF